MVDIKIENVEKDSERVIAHFTVLERREFDGDFSVEYNKNDRGEFVNRDMEGYRAAGGRFADGDKPSPSLMEYVADLLTEQEPLIEARQFWTDD